MADINKTKSNNKSYGTGSILLGNIKPSVKNEVLLRLLDGQTVQNLLLSQGLIQFFLVLLLNRLKQKKKRKQINQLNILDLQ